MQQDGLHTVDGIQIFSANYLSSMQPVVPEHINSV